MRPSSWLGNVLPGPTPRRPGPTARNRRARPRIESLEGKLLLAAGALDATFGVGGRVTTDLLLAKAKDAGAIAVWDARTPSDPGDDQILVAGSAATDYDAPDPFLLARYRADGSLDTTFGSGGTARVSFGNGPATVRGVAFQSDGRVVVAGQYESAGSSARYFALARFTPGGQLDPTFGVNGTVLTDLGAGMSNEAYDVAVDAADRIVMVGTTRRSATADDFALVRYTRDGRLDATFGGSGIVLTDFGGVDNAAQGVTIQPDGRIVVAGTTGRYQLASSYLIARYTDAGLLDAGFDGDGSVVTAFGNGYNYRDLDRSAAVAVDPGGRIVVTGYSAPNNGGGANVLARFGPDGVPDAGFGIGGVATLDGRIRGLAIDSQGRILAATGGLMRFTTGGAPDTAFNGGGRATTASSANALALDGQGRIVIAGNATATDCALARYTDAGGPDAEFNLGRPATVPFPDSSAASYGRDFVLQPDGRAVVAVATSGPNGGRRVALARYTASGALDTTFGVNGVADPGLPGSDWLDQPAGVTLWDNGTPADWSDDKILVAWGRFGVARLTLAGALDTTFGNQGRTLPDIPGDVYDLAVDHLGRVVLAGEKFIPTSGSYSGYYDTAVVRLLPSGAPDGLFGNNGTVVTAHSRYSDGARSVAIDASNRIVVAGYTAGAKNNDFLLARYTADKGVLDTTFNKTGTMVTDFGSNDAGYAVVIQADGKIVVAGGSGGNFALARYTATGALDSTLNKTGKVTTDLKGSDRASAVAIQGDGRIVAAGTSSGRFALARYTTAGGLDTGFGGGSTDIAGTVVTDFGQGDDAAFGVAIRPTGTILTAGYAQSDTTGYDIALAQYTGTSSLLVAAGGEAPGRGAATALTGDRVRPLLAEALARWRAAGVSTTDLGPVRVVIADLPGRTLGMASGGTIFLDVDAAGRGWFLDATPRDDSEFLTLGKRGERHRMDLLSVLAHEVGHLLGHGHEESGVMAESLALGVRQLPGNLSGREVVSTTGDAPASRHGLGARLDEESLTGLAGGLLRDRTKSRRAGSRR